MNTLRASHRCSIFALGIVLTAFCISTARAADAPAVFGVGAVAEVRGDATAASPAGDKVRRLVLDARIQIGERIETVAGATLKIRFDDGSVLSLGEKSVIIVDECVYNAAAPEKCGFMMRMVKGACRMVTGAITDLNPKSFRVKTRMATVGIRGCDLGFRSTSERDDIYVMDLGVQKSVRINTTTDGRDVVNMVTSEDLTVEPSVRKTIDVTQPGRRISVTRGKGVEEATVSLDESSRIVSESSGYAPATYQMDATGDGAVLTIQPGGPAKAPVTPAP